MSEQCKEPQAHPSRCGCGEAAEADWRNALRTANAHTRQLMAERDALHAEAEAADRSAAYYMDELADAKAEAEALRAENGRLKRAVEEGMPRLMQQGYELRTQLEAARGLIGQLRGMINCTVENDTDKMPVWISTKHPVIEHIDALLTATPAPEVQAETLDDRLKQAGLLSVAELLKGAPLDAFIKHAGVHDLATLLQWAEMRRGECLRMMARYDLGEKDKGDDLYEWTVAHCAAFTELHVNLRAALAEQGERQEAACWVPRACLDKLRNGCNNSPAVLTDGPAEFNDTPLYAVPQPGPDVRGLVEALEWCEDWFVKHCPTSKVDGFFPIVHPMLTSIRNALAAHRQAQQGDSHDT